MRPPALLLAVALAAAVLQSALGAASAVATGPAAVGGSGSEGVTALRIVHWTDGARPATRSTWWLRCDPPRGTLRGAARACAALARTGASTLRPVPPDTACTEVYGGPQVVLVTGRIEGRAVWARLRRDDGCQIARWERNRFLIPRG